MIRLAALFIAALTFLAPAQTQTALDRYVAAPDASYKYELINTIKGSTYTAYVLNMTSQTWRSEKDVNKPVWRHYVTIIKPAKVTSTVGFLFIGGGSNTSKPPREPDMMMTNIAITTGTVTANLHGVPNEPVVFTDDGKLRTEDQIIAYTWDKFLRTGDETWPLRLPMTKSAVRAMDAITDFCATAEAGSVKVDRYMVAGGSKRGWTTWTTAAVDKRVIGIAPTVIDTLNLEPAFLHHWTALGFWAPAVGDYVDSDIMAWVGTPQNRALLQIEDPYSYRDRLTMPKYVINSAGDQYFLPDSSQFYFDDLKGEKYLRYIPNTDHSLRGSDVAQGLTAFYDSVINNRPRPKFTWKFEPDGAIRVTPAAPAKPTEVKLWQATNPKQRDFRLVAIGKAYKSTILEPTDKGEYVARVDKPAEGWTAYFVELTYPSSTKYPFTFTTAVRITPDTRPFPPPDIKRDAAHERIEKEIARLSGTYNIGVAAIHIETGRQIQVNAHRFYPMASVYKLPIAIEVLKKVEDKTESLDRMVDLPSSGAALSIGNLLRDMLVKSDNTASDLLLAAAGGPAPVTKRMRSFGLTDVEISRNEVQIAADGDNKPDDRRDTASPYSIARLLYYIHKEMALKPESVKLLLKHMTDSTTGPARIKGFLPAGTPVAHKTGTAWTTVNDAGIITLPNNAGHVALSVFVRAPLSDESEAAIAHIARAVYDYYVLRTTKQQ